MYTFLLVMQYIGCMLFLFEILLILLEKSSKSQTLLLVLGVSGFINMVGYLFEMQSTTMETALMALKFLYLGKPYIILALFFFVVRYCKIHFNRYLEFVLIGIHILISTLVLTCEGNNLFYTSIGYSEDGLFPHLVLGHGVVYYIYLLFMAVYAVAIVALLLFRIRKVKTSKEKKQIAIMITMPIVTLVSMLLFLTGITKGYDLTSMAYLICTVLLNVALFKYRLLDVLAVAKEYVFDHYNDGFLVVDNYDTVLFGNRVVKEILNDADLENEEATLRIVTDLYSKVGNDGYLHFDDKIYEIIEQKIDDNGETVGIMYVINDVTTGYNYATMLEQEVQKKTRNLSIMQRNLTLGLADIIESRDSNTGGHVKRTSDVIKIFVSRLKNCRHFTGYSASFFEHVIQAAPLHDLGKIGVKDAVLNKPGKFTDEEYEEMKTHSQKGAVIIERILDGTEDVEFEKIAINTAYYHHEKVDGTGYPKGLKGDEIPPEARIMALADVFDALVSKRCYKKEMSYDQAFTIIEQSLGSHFDEEFGRHFLECRKELEAFYDACS